MHVRRRIFIEVTLGALGLVLAVTTAIWHGWIEGVFGVDPDHGSASLEWAIVIAFAGAGVILWVVARLDWKRTITADLVASRIGAHAMRGRR